MDYEKAYNEALERARADYNNHLEEGYKNYREHLETIFPELRESEDERIRKAIIKSIEEDSSVYEQEVSKEQMLAYLEKQKDLQFDYPGIYFYDGEKLHFQGNPAIEENPYDFAMSQQEKQKEQKPISQEDFDAAKHEALWEEPKPVEKQDYSGLNDLERAIHRGFLSAGVENVPVTIIRETAQDCLAQIKPAEIDFEDRDMLDYIRNILRKRVRKDEDFNCLDKWLTEHYVIQKPAWSEEDIKNFNKISAILLDASEVKCWWEKSRIIEKEEMNKLTEWLNLVFNSKLLRPQPKQEWSESDDLMLQSVYETLYDHQSGIRTGAMGKIDRDYVAAIDKEIAWLKSLRPGWKPNKKNRTIAENICTIDLEDGLCDIQDNFYENSYQYKVLEEAIEFIRHTKTQSHWKPSEEQMEALRIAAYEPHKNWNEKLQELYEQIKKL